jgi:hypothetical protein
MSRITEVIAAAYAVRHCTEYGCRKCIARARWGRRKKWQSRKSPIRRATGTK